VRASLSLELIILGYNSPTHQAADTSQAAS